MPKQLATTYGAYRLLHEGAMALSEIESNGVRVDKAYLERTLDETAEQIKRGEESLRADPVYSTWRKHFGEKTNLGSYDQLARVIFGVMGHTPRHGKTASEDREAANEAAFDHVNLPFVKNWFNVRKIHKGRGTYLLGIQREMVQGRDGCWYIHPHYHLNTTITHRSSCSSPNWTNIPTRNEMLAEMIRRCYIPRPGNHLLEFDYGQIEVRIPCCYNFDPVLMDYVRDTTKDMHRDMACQIFFLNPKQVSKECRHIAKNEFVFPTFYGSYYAQCAPHIWESIQARKIKVEGTETLLIEHLRDNGIITLGACDPDETPVEGSFEKHLKAIEDDFWGRRFKVYAQWKRDWWDAYQRNGGFMTLTGFAITIPLNRKQACNSPIQGDAFNCSLWSLPRINSCLRRYKFKTRVIGEIHDCVNMDGPAKEREDVIELTIKIMTQDIRKDFTWLNVPLVVEPELCPIDRPWFHKASLVEKNGSWVPSDLTKWEKKYGDWALQVA